MSVALNSIAIAALFCVFEFVWAFLVNNLPWFNFYAGNTLEGNLYAVQPASIFGVSILSFIVVIVNYLVAVYITEKSMEKTFNTGRYNFNIHVLRVYYFSKFQQ